MSSPKSPQASSQTDWDSMFSFDPTTSPFFPPPDAEHDPTHVSTNLDIFAAQPLFLPEVYFPQPNYFPDQPASQIPIAQMLPYEPASGCGGVEGITHGSTFDAIRGDLDKVIVSVWQLKNDYQKRVHNLDLEVAQASKEADSLRKDVDAIGGWVEQVVAFLNAEKDPAELPGAEEPKHDVQEEGKVPNEGRAQ